MPAQHEAADQVDGNTLLQDRREGGFAARRRELRGLQTGQSTLGQDFDVVGREGVEGLLDMLRARTRTLTAAR